MTLPQVPGEEQAENVGKLSRVGAVRGAESSNASVLRHGTGRTDKAVNELDLIAGFPRRRQGLSLRSRGGRLGLVMFRSTLPLY